RYWMSMRKSSRFWLRRSRVARSKLDSTGLRLRPSYAPDGQRPNALTGCSAGALLPRRALGQLVAAVIVFVRGMAFSPNPFGVMTGRHAIELFPQISVHYGLLRGRYPVLPLPAVDPGCNAILHVLRIGDDLHLAALLQRAQAFDSRCQLHAVVGGLRSEAVYFLVVFAVPENARPPARSGVAQARAIRDQPDLLHPASAASSSRLKNSSTISR